MTATGVRGVLLDVEGTTSSVAFVYDVLFPYARRSWPTSCAAAGTSRPWPAPAT